MPNQLATIVQKYPYIMFGGKGGLGKTTFSAATAYWLAEQGKKVLVFSVDPQASLSDIFQRDIFGKGPVEIKQNLYAQEIDADTHIKAYQNATDREFANFEIRIDWKATKGGNSGLMYGVVEDKKYDAAWKTGPEPVHRRRGLPPEAGAVAARGSELRHAPPQQGEAAQAGGGVEQHADRREREARRTLAQREEDPRVRALDGRVEEAPRLREVEGGPGLRDGEDRPHRPPGPRQRLLVPQHQAPLLP